MINLLITSEVPPDPDGHCFGGLPVIPIGSRFSWPTCKSCTGNMQYLGRIRVPHETTLILLFMCQNDPGLCDEWAPDSGGNTALVVGIDSLTAVEPPSGGVTSRNTVYGVREVASSHNDYEEARAAWGEQPGHRQRDVLGQLLGAPSWIQADETPACDVNRL